MPPAAEKLKYLVFKNHGMLLLTELQREIEDDDSRVCENDVVDRLGSILDDFSEALIYDDGDPAFLTLICSLSMSLGYTSVGRWALDCIINSETRVTPLDVAFNSGELLGPLDYSVLDNLYQLLKSIDDTYTLESCSVFKTLERLQLNPKYTTPIPDFSWLIGKFNVKDTIAKVVDRELQQGTLDIIITTKDWVSIAEAVQEACANLVKGKRKLGHEDPYLFAQTSITTVKFVLPHGETIMPKEPESSTEIEINQEEQNGPGDSDKVPEPLSGDPADRNMIRLPSTPTNLQSIPTATASPLSKKRKLAVEDSNRRNSKRVKAMTDGHSVNHSADDAFIENLNAFLRPCSVKFKTVLPIYHNGPFSAEDQYIRDLKTLLEGWDDEQSDIFLETSTVSDISKINRQPVMQVLDSASLGTNDSVRLPFTPSTRDIDQFLQRINSGKYHILEVRLELLKILLGSRTKGCCLAKDQWPPSLLDSVKRLFDTCESYIYQYLMQSTFTGTGEHSILEICESIYELTVDFYISCERQIRSSKSQIRMHLKEVEHNKAMALTRLLRWNGLFSDILSLWPKDRTTVAEIILRHEWVSILIGEVYEESPDDTLYLFRQLLQSIESSTYQDIDVEFPNFANVPTLSLSGIRTQISKYEVASIFAKIFHGDAEAEVTETSANEKKHGDRRSESVSPVEGSEEPKISLSDKISILESILMPDEHESQWTPQHEALAHFMSSASLQFRLQLWYLLLDGYNRVGEGSKAFDGYVRIFIASVDEFSQKSYSEVPEHRRLAQLLRSINICLDLTTGLLKLVLENESLLEGLPADRISQTFEALIRLLRMLHIYILFDDSINNNTIQAPSHPLWDRSAQKFGELIVSSWSLFYFFYRSILSEEHRNKPDILNDILSIIHEEIGVRGYCGLLNGVFLDLCLKEMLRLDWSESENDMLQCMQCRYGLAIGTDYFQPYDHHVTPSDIDRQAAMKLSKFLMGMIFRKKNLQQSTQRVDIKGVLDQFYESIGDPDSDNFSIARNSSEIERLLEGPFTLRFLQDCLRGRVYQSLVTGPDPIFAVANYGFYYVLGQSQLNLFKIRKRTMPGRTDDVEEAIKFFKSDLICNTGRFESWLGLAQAYDALAEDDLTWTADKVNNPNSRKEVTTNQRRSIIACAMAINGHIQNSRLSAQELEKIKTFTLAHYTQLVSGIYSFFAKILYNAAQPPCDLEAFEIHLERMYFGPEGVIPGTLEHKVKKETILSIIYRLTKLATKEQPGSWYNYYLQAKVLHKLMAQPSEVLKPLLKAVELTGVSSNDYVLEPHYKLVSFLFKRVWGGKISPSVGLEYLKKTPYYDSKEPRELPREIKEKKMLDERNADSQISEPSRETNTRSIPVHMLTTADMKGQVSDSHSPHLNHPYRSPGPVMFGPQYPPPISGQLPPGSVPHGNYVAGPYYPSSCPHQHELQPNQNYPYISYGAPFPGQMPPHFSVPYYNNSTDGQQFIMMTPPVQQNFDHSVQEIELPTAVTAPPPEASKTSADMERFYSDCITTLLKIRQMDKKKWHHRPTYRLAKIHELVYGDSTKAKREMSNLFYLKSNNKAPLHIWKPEHERPGHHFEFIFQYVMYFITLLKATEDWEAFGILARKLRRFSSGMTKHQTAWESLCSNLVNTAKHVLEVPWRFSEHLVPTLVYDEFAKSSLEMQEDVEKDKSLIRPWYYALDYAAEIKRLNNGFGSTAAVDDLFVVSYLMIYQEYVTRKNEAASSALLGQPPREPFSTKISVQSLVLQWDEPPQTPETPPPVSVHSSPSKPTSTEHGTPVKEGESKDPTSSQTGPEKTKTRVTRRDVISRALNFAKIISPRLNLKDTKYLKPPEGNNVVKTNKQDNNG